MTDDEMSPEQVAELQKQNCIFCHIVSGKVNSKKIFEDDVCVAILDINPANPGHMLLVPKEHYTLMALVPEDVVQHMGMVIKGLSQAALKALKVEGTNIMIANGAVAGQKAPHFMVHLIPRKQGDGISAFRLSPKRLEASETEKLRVTIREKLSQFMPDMPSETEPAGSEEPADSPAEEPVIADQEPEASVDLDSISDLLVGTPQKSPEQKSPEQQQLPEPSDEKAIRSQSHIEKQSRFIASRLSDKFHIPQCPLAKKIRPGNRIWFDSEEEARRFHERCDCLR